MQLPVAGARNMRYLLVAVSVSVAHAPHTVHTRTFFFGIIALLSEREYNSCRRIPEPNGAAAIDRRLVERMANCTQRISASPKHTNMPRARARTAITRACA